MASVYELQSNLGLDRFIRAPDMRYWDKNRQSEVSHLEAMTVLLGLHRGTLTHNNSDQSHRQLNQNPLKPDILDTTKLQLGAVAAFDVNTINRPGVAPPVNGLETTGQGQAF